MYLLDFKKNSRPKLVLFDEGFIFLEYIGNSNHLPE